MAVVCLGRITLFWILFGLVSGQICTFYHQGYIAACKYPVDGIAMTYITVTVNHCSDPIDVTFKVSCKNPDVEWQHTFANDNEMQVIPGFYDRVELQVELGMNDENQLLVRAVFDVEGRGKTSFMDQRVEIRNVEQCIELNKAGRIALGCLIVLLIIAGVLLAVLLVIRRKRILAERTERTLVQNMESHGEVDLPPNSEIGTSEMSVPVVRFSLPSIPEHPEIFSDVGHVNIELANRTSETVSSGQGAGLPY